MYLKTFLNGNNIVTNIVVSDKLELKQMQEELNCRMIDIVNLNENIAVICDDEGLLVSQNPVFSLITENGLEQEIAGTFMLAKNIMTSKGMSNAPFNSMEEAQQLIGKMKIGLIGVTR